MNSNFHKISSVALLALGLGSCYKTIELDIPEQKLLAVVNQMEEESTPVSGFVLSKTMSIVDYRPGYDNNGIPYENNFEAITNATATVFENGKQVEKFTSSGSNEYRGSYVMTEGNTYTLEIALPNDNETLSATYKMPLCIAASVSNYKETAGTDPFIPGTTISATVTIRDPEPAEGNYLKIKVVNSAGEEWGFSSRSLILTYLGDVGAGLPGGNSDQARFYTSAYALDDLFNGTQFSFDLNFNDAGEAPMFIEVTSVPRELYLFEKTKILQQENDGDPLAQPTEIFSNVKGGLGIFAYGSTKITEIK